MLDLIARLKEIGRFDRSFIVIHGDHGGFYRLEGNALTPSESTSRRSLLLFKPIGRSQPFAVSESEASLMDIAPTLLDSLSVENELVFDGKVLKEVVK
jgi:arylsulfatase A-like enzyme